MSLCPALTAVSNAGVRGGRPAHWDRIVTTLRLRRLDRRLDRSWRQGLAQRDAELLTAVRRRVDTVPLLAATTKPGSVITGSELVFLDGLTLQLGPCHRPAVAALADAIATGQPVMLCRAAHHGRFWELDFGGGGGGGGGGRRIGPLALLARSASVAEGGGAAQPVTLHPVALAY